MGEGLADNRPEFAASGREWRTAPLWGIGLTEKINGHTRFLHDGRAAICSKPFCGTAAKRNSQTSGCRHAKNQTGSVAALPQLLVMERIPCLSN